MSPSFSPSLSKRPSRRRKSIQASTPTADCRAIQARHLDLQANCLLQAGHRAAAEVLAWRALAIREAGR